MHNAHSWQAGALFGAAGSRFTISSCVSIVEHVVVEERTMYGVDGIVWSQNVPFGGRTVCGTAGASSSFVRTISQWVTCFSASAFVFGVFDVWDSSKYCERRPNERDEQKRVHHMMANHRARPISSEACCFLEC